MVVSVICPVENNTQAIPSWILRKILLGHTLMARIPESGRFMLTYFVMGAFAYNVFHYADTGVAHDCFRG
jgi:hypothetical protein